MTGKKIFVFILILGLLLLLPKSCKHLKIGRALDGATIELNNGTIVRLIGVSSTVQGYEELKRLVGNKVNLQPDGYAKFDPRLLKGKEVVDAYVLLPSNGNECLNATLLRKGYCDLVLDAGLNDSLNAFSQYAGYSMNRQSNDRVVLIPMNQEIDYASDDIDLPNYTPSADRRLCNWYEDKQKNIDMLKEACDYNLPYTKMFANQLAARSPGEFSIEQVCEIYDYCRGKWRYVNDPKGQDYEAKASETIAASLTGDCDDYAILMASCLLACGGDVCIVYANGSNGCHAYAEVDVNSFKKNKSLQYVNEVIAERFAVYEPGSAKVREHDEHIWLNLDWQASYPGGPFFEAEEKVYYTVVDAVWNWNI